MAGLHTAEVIERLTRISRLQAPFSSFGHELSPSILLDAIESTETPNPIFTIDTHISRYISSNLKHISVNQSNKLNSLLITSSYVMAKGDENTYVNANSSSVNTFINALSQSAIRERHLSLTQDELAREGAINENPIFLLHGDRGIGKTFFLNYAVSEHSQDLDKSKVIWVRINLVYKSDYEGDIEAWMLAQSLKILMRYYEISSKHNGPSCIDIRNHIFNWIDKNPDLQAREIDKLRADFRTIISTFSELGGDIRVKPSICNGEICKEVYRFCRESGWSFIFIIDGFDQLDTSSDHEARFENIKDDIVKFISMRSNFGASILVVSRTNTITDMNSFDPFKSIEADNRFVIGTPAWQDVINRRFDAIEKAVLDKIPDDYNIDRGKLKSTLSSFNFSWKDGMDAFASADEALSRNLRAIMQVLYLQFVDFMDEKSGKGYQVIEHMMLNGHRYPVVAYDYALDEAGELVGSASTEINHESRFLPLVTRPPWPSKSRRPRVGVCGDILLMVRCIQLVMAATELKAQELPTIGELSELLHHVFGYERTMTIAAIKELSSFEIVRLHIQKGLSVRSKQNRVSSLPKADYFLKRCLFDIAYLNMCSMRTPLPSVNFKRGNVTLESLGRPGHRLELWIPTKLKNAYFLFSLILNACEIEQVGWLGRKKVPLEDRKAAILRKAESLGLWQFATDSIPVFAAGMVRALSSSSGGVFGFSEQLEVGDDIRRFMDSVLTK
jgi:Cdc6-like AAA superfamily ATPase